MTERPDASSAALPPAAAGWRRQDVFFFLPVGFLWIVLIDHLRIEWSVNAQYNYGWAVPLLCAYLGWRARSGKAESGKRESGGFDTSPLALMRQLGRRTSSGLRPPSPQSGEGNLPGRGGEGGRQEGGKRGAGSGLALGLLLLWAALYLPTRLVQEANPEWRLVSWALALIVVGLTLVFVHRVYGGGVLRWAAFPILFFFVAVPWPTVIEAPLIQQLAAFNAAGAVEVLNLLGIPALGHGNVIEISAGLVGVEDACSGIRSFQACLMIGLFLGAYHRLRVSRRLALVAGGFLLAILFNLGRTVLLVAIASWKGIPAIAEWHDPAGVTILVGCFLGVWAMSAMFARRGGTSSIEGETAASSTPHPQSLAPVEAEREVGGKGESGERAAGEHSTFNIQHSTSSNERGGGGAPVALSVALLLWLAACEAGVEFWYARHESRVRARATWDVRLPAETPGFRELPFEARTIQLLRFDEGRNATWTDSDGTRCQAIFLRWNPGRIAVHLARSHTPEVCLTSSGHKLTGGIEPRSVTIGGLSLAFDVYHAERDELWVYYCLWEDGFSNDSNETERLTYGNRLRPVFEGRRNRGQRSLEIAVWSNASAEEVHLQVTRLLQSVVQPSSAGKVPPVR